MLSKSLNAVIRFALHNRALVAALAVFVLLYGAWQSTRLPIDVFPDLNRPRVVVMTEAPGLAPEEVEARITFPLETALNGASGVQAVRSSSGIGLSVIYVEFDWGTNIFTDRQIVTERLDAAGHQLPPGVKPQLATVSSIMGQIVVAGMYSRPVLATRLFNVPGEAAAGQIAAELDVEVVPAPLRAAFEKQNVHLSSAAFVRVQRLSRQWSLADPETKRWFTLAQTAGGLEVHRATSPMELRTLADWVVRQQLLTIPGVSQVFVMGGERKQFQVLVNPDLLLKYGVTLQEVKHALAESNQNATGGYLDEQGPNELLVRALGRVDSIRNIEEIVVKPDKKRAVTLGHVARVVEGPQIKRGDSSAYVRDDEGDWAGGSAVVLTINKQPGADTRQVSDDIAAMLVSLEGRLPQDVALAADLYQQQEFITRAIDNIEEALRDGSILVVIILFLFLLNFRTTFITLTAIPLSITITILVFKAFGMGINTMTLGGLAVAIGELVDDAIVDVENIFRRLRENKHAAQPKPTLLVIYQASVEIRNSIVFGTMIVVLVFIPLFALGGMEGKLFAPLGVAYIVSILASLLVSLTVTPILAYWLLPSARFMEREKDSLLLRGLKWVAGGAMRFSLRYPIPILAGTGVLVLAAGLVVWQPKALKPLLSNIGYPRLQRDFLPPFDEGAVQINVVLPPGTSLKQSNARAELVMQRLHEIPEIHALVRRTGRAELDEHAEGVNHSEIIASLDAGSGRGRDEILTSIRDKLAEVPDVVTSVEQPLAHLISHMVSGVKAQVAIKIYGEDLDTLRKNADRMKAAIADVDGVKDLQIEPQVTIPQLRIETDGAKLKQYGLLRGDVTRFVETAMQGDVVSEVLEGQKKFDLIVRLDDEFREDRVALERLSLQLPSGGRTTLGSVARLYVGGGPNTVNREKVQRRIVIQANVADRGLVDVVEDMKERLAPIEATLPTGYFVEYGGQFESEQSASRMLGILFLVSLAGIFLVLFTLFRSANLALQEMTSLPTAFIGSVAALLLTEQRLTVAAMVGFISMCGITCRNGILLINHYLHLVKYEGEGWTKEMIVRAGKERLAPVLMTALTAGIALVPIALAAGEPGKEILYPVATVIIGGLISSTTLEYFVRPALFWLWGMKAAKAVTEEEQQEVALVEETQAKVKKPVRADEIVGV